MNENSNPQGRCMYCGEPVRYKDKYCSRCGKPNDNWQEASQSECGNCHAHLQKDDKYCRICGTKVGEGAYEPYQDFSYYLYGPEPILLKHTCRGCGYMWFNWNDDEKYCPQCGGIADLVSASSEEASRFQEEIRMNLIC